MKAFFIKYKGLILSWLILVSILFIFVPGQKANYLQADIANFEDKYFVPVLFWLWTVISIVTLVLVIINTKSIKDSVAPFVCISFIIAFSMLTLKDVLLSGALFVNKLYKRDTAQKVYKVVDIVGEKQGEINLLLIDVANQTVAYDEKLKRELYHSELKRNDTVRLTVNIGILGIAFPNE